jgi:hypothetical protein
VAAGALLLVSQASGTLARAAEPPPDADLLEFLGTVDTADNGLKEYLERTDVEKIAANRAPTAGQGAADKPVPAGRPADSRPTPAASKPAPASETSP